VAPVSTPKKPLTVPRGDAGLNRQEAALGLTNRDRSENVGHEVRREPVAVERQRGAPIRLECGERAPKGEAADLAPAEGSSSIGRLARVLLRRLPRREAVALGMCPQALFIAQPNGSVTSPTAP
jgi:hypothetical protein